MKKKFLGGLLIVAIAAATAFNVNMNLNTNDDIVQSNITLTNIEAIASLGEWWDRKDYDCVQITCRGTFNTEWYAWPAQFMGEGKGTYAHTWNCSGC